MKNFKSALLTFIFLSITFAGLFAQDQDKRSGYFNNTKLGFISVLSEEYGGGLISTVNGWHFTENLSAGIGIAAQGYRDVPTFYPISAHAAYFLKETITSPYVYGNVGYSLTFEELYRGNISYELGLGWQFKVGGISLGPEVGFRREGWQVRTPVVTETPDATIIAFTGPYRNDFLRQINFGVSLYF